MENLHLQSQRLAFREAIAARRRKWSQKLLIEIVDISFIYPFLKILILQLDPVKLRSSIMNFNMNLLYS